nr:alpha-galactosidase [Nakamurella aerolata]
MVLDLTLPAAWQHVRDQVDAILTEYDIDYVKWDHNRDLLEAGSNAHGNVAAFHHQTAAHAALLADLRARHPAVQWESCSSGGGRVDLQTIEQVQRFWASDMTDALMRQHIQRWTAQLVAPEYLGAHVSAPVSHQTGRAIGLDFRCATALFGSFGIEWDLSDVSQPELDRLAWWVQRYREWKPLLHSGRMFRIDTGDPAILAHGVVGPDRDRALLACVQLDESRNDRGVTLRIPGLEPDAEHSLRWWEPMSEQQRWKGAGLLPETGPVGDDTVTGKALSDIGIWLPRRHPQTVLLVQLAKVTEPG